MKRLTDAAKIVEVLGGREKVAELTEATNVKAVWNWPYFGVFPPNTYKVMTDELERLGYTAPPYLWKQKGFDKPKRAA
jgi:hypothetical protein